MSDIATAQIISGYDIVLLDIRVFHWFSSTMKHKNVPNQGNQKGSSIESCLSVDNSDQRDLIYEKCYDLKLKVLSDKTTLVLSNTRELDRVPSTK